MSDFSFIKVDIENQTAIITMNRPDVFNAMNKAMKKEIIKAIKTANSNDQVRSIILTGEGKAFSSGQDLNDRTVNADEGPVDLGKTLETEWNPLINALCQSEKIVIAAINGVCAGAGLSVAMACDLKIAAEGIRFISGFSSIGLTLDAGMDHVFVRRLGYTKALEFALFSKPMMSNEMLEAGLLNQICKLEELKERAKEMSAKINALAPLSVKIIKKNMRFAQDHSLEEVITRETASQRFLGNTKDYQEGVAAFLGKRKPEFKGE